MKPALHADEGFPICSPEAVTRSIFRLSSGNGAQVSPYSGRWLCALTLLALLVVSTGCSRKPDKENAKKADAPLSEDRCQQKLGSALEMLHAERTPSAAEFEVAVSMLNEWKTDCGEGRSSSGTGQKSSEGDEEIEQDNVAFSAMKKLLTDAELKAMREPRFDLADGRHIRDSRTFREIANQLVQKRRSDLDRAVDLFYYTVRNVSLQTAGESVLPMNSYRIIIFGRGTAADRAWIFTSLLRQLRIDSAILIPDGKGDNPLVAVFIEEKIYLFDPKLGLPIPAIDERTMSPLPRQPATLSEVLEQDVAFRQLDAEGSRYPLASADMKNLRIQCVGDPSFWSPRMRVLQAALTGERSLVVFDPLGDTSIGQGVLSRIADYGKKYWKKSEIGIWSHPYDSEKGVATLSDDQKTEMNAREAAMAAPHTLTYDKQSKKLVPIRLREQHRNRIAQLMGRQADAIKQFVQVRHKIVSEIAPDDPLAPAAKQANARAIEDASLWTGAAQFEQEDFRSASETLRQVLIQSGEQTASTAHARLLLSISTASEDKFALAMEVLRGNSNPPLNPNLREFLLKRWRTIRAAQEEMERSGKPSPPTSSKPAASPTTPEKKTPAATGETKKPTPVSPEKTLAKTPGETSEKAPAKTTTVPAK